MSLLPRRQPPRLPGPVSQRYEQDQRRRMAEALRQQGASMAPVETPFVGLARALGAGIGGIQGRAVDREYQTQADDYNRTLAEAMRMYGTDPQAAIARLGQNPDFAEPAMRMGVDYAAQQARSKMEREAADLKYQRDMDMARAKQAMRPPETRTFMQGSEKVTEQYDPNTRQWTEIGRGPAWNPNPSSAVSISYGQPVAGVDPKTGQPVFFQPSKDGGAPAIIPGVAPPPENTAPVKLTEGERKAAGLYSRLKQELANIEQITSTDETARTPDIAADTAKKVPLVGEYIGRGMLTEGRKRVEDAQLNALDAALTLTTGAAYTREQLENLRASYFAVPGDTPSVIADKETRFRTLVDAARVSAGNAADEIESMQQGATGSWGEPAAPDSADPLGLRR